MGPLTAGVTGLKCSLHEVPAYPSQRLIAVNLVTLMRLLRPRRRVCLSRALHTSTLLPAASDKPRQCRSYSGPSGDYRGAISRSDGSSTPCRRPRPNIPRVCRCPSTFETTSLRRRTPAERHASRPADVSHRSEHGKQERIGMTPRRAQISVGGQRVTW